MARTVAEICKTLPIGSAPYPEWTGEQQKKLRRDLWELVQLLGVDVDRWEQDWTVREQNRRRSEVLAALR